MPLYIFNCPMSQANKVGHLSLEEWGKTWFPKPSAEDLKSHIPSKNPRPWGVGFLPPLESAS